jgi:hypothetical protein
MLLHCTSMEAMRKPTPLQGPTIWFFFYYDFNCVAEILTFNAIEPSIFGMLLAESTESHTNRRSNVN